jgi:hypothetical protein
LTRQQGTVWLACIGHVVIWPIRFYRPSSFLKPKRNATEKKEMNIEGDLVVKGIITDYGSSGEVPVRFGKVSLRNGGNGCVRYVTS